jgi:carbon monoxide dehydrogenase subunit G
VAEWNDHVQHVEVVGDGPIAVGSRLRQHRLRNRREFVLEFEVVAHEPPTRHVVEGTVFGVATTMAFLLEPAEEGTRVTMDAHVRGEGPSRLLAPIVTREMRKSTVTALDDLRRVLGDES